jgi:hypothetical protein
MMKYKPNDGRKVVPMVRLSVLMEGAMPDGPAFDPEWQAKLETTIETFKKEGVYVFLDIHQDALSSVNGGDGLPWWMAAKMQITPPAGCYFCKLDDSYVVSPDHPPDLALPSWVRRKLAHRTHELPTRLTKFIVGDWQLPN